MATFNKFQAVYREPFAITPSDSTNLSKPTRGGIYVGTPGATGTVVAVLYDGSTVTFTGIPAGTVVPVEAIRVNTTGTDASDLVGLY